MRLTLLYYPWIIVTVFFVWFTREKLGRSWWRVGAMALLWPIASLPVVLDVVAQSVHRRLKGLTLLCLIALVACASPTESAAQTDTLTAKALTAEGDSATIRVAIPRSVPKVLPGVSVFWKKPQPPPPVDTTPKPPPPPPPPPSGKKFFTADAESGGLAPWSTGYLPSGTGGIPAATSSAKAHSGTRSYKFEVPAAGATNNAHYSQLWGGGPQISMGTPSGHFGSGCYSFWLYMDAGWNSTDRTNWNTLLGWMTGTGNAPRPMYDIGLRLPPGGGPLQLMFHLSSAANADAGVTYTAPNIPGYLNASNGYYFTTASSPSGVVPFPRQQWVHVTVRDSMAATNGRITIWQDAKLLMDLKAPTLNTLRGAQGSNPAGDAALQFGIYGGPDSGDQRLYADDFTISDVCPAP